MKNSKRSRANSVLAGEICVHHCEQMGQSLTLKRRWGLSNRQRRPICSNLEPARARPPKLGQLGLALRISVKELFAWSSSFLHTFTSSFLQIFCISVTLFSSLLMLKLNIYQLSIIFDKHVYIYLSWHVIERFR